MTDKDDAQCEICEGTFKEDEMWICDSCNLYFCDGESSNSVFGVGDVCDNCDNGLANAFD